MREILEKLRDMYRDLRDGYSKEKEIARQSGQPESLIATLHGVVITYGLAASRLSGLLSCRKLNKDDVMSLLEELLERQKRLREEKDNLTKESYAYHKVKGKIAVGALIITDLQGALKF